MIRRLLACLLLVFGLLLCSITYAADEPGTDQSAGMTQVDGLTDDAPLATALTAIDRTVVLWTRRVYPTRATDRMLIYGEAALIDLTAPPATATTAIDDLRILVSPRRYPRIPAQRGVTLP